MRNRFQLNEEEKNRIRGLHGIKSITEQILRTKELMGILITERLHFPISLSEWIEKLSDTEDLAHGQVAKYLFREGDALMAGAKEEDCRNCRRATHLKDFKFTKGDIEDLEESVPGGKYDGEGGSWRSTDISLPYEVINDTVVFEAGPVIGPSKPAVKKPEVKKITFKEARKCFTDNGAKAEDYIEACFKKEVIDVTDSVSWSYIGGDECINKITEDGLDDVVSCLTGK